MTEFDPKYPKILYHAINSWHTMSSKLYMKPFQVFMVLILLQWYEKNIRAQTVLKPKDQDTKEDERNPVWLCDKAG